MVSLKPRFKVGASAAAAFAWGMVTLWIVRVCILVIDWSILDAFSCSIRASSMFAISEI